jgi:hypothetical protein
VTAYRFDIFDVAFECMEFHGLMYGGIARSGLNLSPVMLWVNIGEWFTDGYADIVWCGFERRGIVLSLTALTIIVAVALLRFGRKNLI